MRHDSLSRGQVGAALGSGEPLAKRVEPRLVIGLFGIACHQALQVIQRQQGGQCYLGVVVLGECDKRGALLRMLWVQRMKCLETHLGIGVLPPRSEQAS